MKKAAIYIRVSTDAQREEGYSIDAQKEALMAYCISKGLRNYELYIDGGYTGSNLDRPAMQQLIRDVEAERISHVVVYKLDRLSRSQKDTLYLIEDVLNPHGVAFISLNESMDTGTPMGRLMLGILSAFAQLERENIRERTRMGMKERVKAGYWMGGGKIPFGYDYDVKQGILVPNQDAETVREIYHLYLKGYSPANIAEMTGLKYDQLITQILKRKTNTGVIVYKGEEYPGRHEPLISRDTYDRAMLEMEKRSGKNLHSQVNLLTGLVYCGHCGAKMRYQKWGHKGHKLVCYSRQGSKPYLIKDPDCPQEHIWADEVEDAVIQDLFRFSAEKTMEPETDPAKSALQIIEEQIIKAEKKLRRLYQLYADADDTVLFGYEKKSFDSSDTDFENQWGIKKDQMLKEEIDHQKSELKKLYEKRQMEEERQILSKNRSAALKKISSLSQVWDSMTQMEKRSIMDQVIEKVTVKDQCLTIDYKL